MYILFYFWGFCLLSSTDNQCRFCFLFEGFVYYFLLIILRILFVYYLLLIIMAPKQSLGDILCLLRFLLLLLLLLFFLSFFRQKFVRHISRRCLDQTLWNLVGISYAMWSCAFKGWFFQNGCRCHGNGQNAKKKEKHKNDHSRLLAEQKLMNLDRNNIHI